MTNNYGFSGIIHTFRIIPFLTCWLFIQLEEKIFTRVLTQSRTEKARFGSGECKVQGVELATAFPVLCIGTFRQGLREAALNCNGGCFELQRSLPCDSTSVPLGSKGGCFELQRRLFCNQRSLPYGSTSAPLVPNGVSLRNGGNGRFCISLVYSDLVNLEIQTLFAKNIFQVQNF